MYSELEINIKFPTCWDGQTTESASGDHVMYAPQCDGEEHEECFEFACPSSHPVRMPEIHLYVRVLGYEVNTNEVESVIRLHLDQRLLKTYFYKD